jgi:hypothetical protein
MSKHLEMGVVRDGGASLNGSGVECGIRKVEMRNGSNRKVLQSGAALKAIVRGEITGSDRRCIVYSVQFVMVSKCAHFLRIATPYLLTIVTNAARIETMKP